MGGRRSGLYAIRTSILLLVVAACGSSSRPAPQARSEGTRTNQVRTAPHASDDGVNDDESSGLAAPRHATASAHAVRTATTFDEAALRALEDTFTTAVVEEKLPGGVLVIGSSAGVHLQRAFGYRDRHSTRTWMSEDTIFDLASLTKVMVVLPALLQLEAAGALSLGDRVKQHLPEVPLEDVTIAQLLRHEGGLPGAPPLTHFDGPSRKVVISRLLSDARAVSPVGQTRYSDYGFIVLGELVSRVSGLPLPRFAEERIFAPLGMASTRYNPPASWPIAPTERIEPKRRHHTGPFVPHEAGPFMRGAPHDPRAFRLGGVAGHAGLFGSAADLARYATAWLTVARGQRSDVWPAEGARRALTKVRGRGLAWDMRARAEDGFSTSAFYHTGHAGMFLLVDPERDLFFVFASHRVHPDGKGNIHPLLHALSRIVTGSWPQEVPAQPAVRTGIDALLAQDRGEVNAALSALSNKPLGLLTNRSARTAQGTPTLEALLRDSRFRVVKLFAPEHGFSAAREGHIDDGHGPYDVPMVSLFGRRRTPTPADLDGLSAVVVDLQDVGARFYTYGATLHAMLDAAREASIPVFVLDRPIPIGGGVTAGPLLDVRHRSFVNHAALPIRPGMTLGEMARFIAPDVTRVIRVSGYDASRSYADLRLPFFSPSPNLRTIEQTLLYPGVALIEGTNLSVGRGLPEAFHVVGAPYVDPRRLRSALERAAERWSVHGIRFEETAFTPSSGTFRGRLCRGVSMKFQPGAARPEFDSVSLGFALIEALKRTHARRWDTTRLVAMVGDDAVLSLLLKGEPPMRIRTRIAEGMKAFLEARERALLYPRTSSVSR